MPDRLHYLRLRAESLWRSRGMMGLLRFVASCLVRLRYDLVFERATREVAPNAGEMMTVGRLIAISRANLDDPAIAHVVLQILSGEAAIYRPGLDRRDRIFAVVDAGDKVLHHSFVEFETRHKALIGEAAETPIFANCWTSPEMRGMRLFPATLERGCEALARDGFERVLIDCDPRNLSSRNGIERAGFRKIRSISSVVFLSRLAIQRIEEVGGPTVWRAAILRLRPMRV